MPAQQVAHPSGLPDFKKLLLSTGNVLRSNVAKRGKVSNAELLHAIEETVHRSLHANTPPSFHYDAENSTLNVPDPRQNSRIAPEDRNDVKVTAKLFYLNSGGYPASYIEEAIQHLKTLLGVTSIDSFIISFGGQRYSSDIWLALEQLHQQDIVKRLGVADFDLDELQAFLGDERLSQRPTINQVNVGQCCNMPQALIALAQQHHIELLHNGDRSEILSTDELSALLRQSGVTKAMVAPRWVVKYDVFVKCRGVVADKGYVVAGDVVSA